MRVALNQAHTALRTVVDPLAETRLPVGITMGDAAGIGPEIIVKLCAAGLPWPAIVYGDAGILRATAQRLNLPQALDAITVRNRCAPLPPDLPHGVVSGRAGHAAHAFLCHAIDDAMAQRLCAIVTAPLNKASLHAAGIAAPGHTEVLAERTRTRDVAMMLLNPELRVILVTIHVALAEVSRMITLESELRTIRLAHLACCQAGIATPRIAVAGLNPHAGEAGRFGQEERHVIAPAVKKARAEGLQVSGPWPGDTVFMRARRGEFDIVVAQYHDQGLIPVKYLGVDHGVNVTVGLPFVRTSVDHGTAFDIAGTGKADPTSLRAAFDVAVQLGARPAFRIPV